MTVRKLGLKIPNHTPDYQCFVLEMQAAEQEFKKAIESLIS